MEPPSLTSTAVRRVNPQLEITWPAAVRLVCVQMGDKFKGKPAEAESAA